MNSLIKKCFLTFFLVFFAVLLIDIISFYDKRVTIVFFSLVSIAFIYFFGHIFSDKINKLSDKTIFCFSAAVIIFMTIMLVITGFYMISDPKTDWGTVYESMQDILSTGHIRTISAENDCFYPFAHKSYNDYFLIYPNNFFCLFMLTVYYKILSIFGMDVFSDNALYAGILLNVFFIVTAVVSGAVTAKKIYGNGGCIAFVLLAALFVPYYIHAYRFYTDTLSLPFPILVILFYIYADKCQNKRKYIYSALIGIFACIGILMKASSGIVLIAVVIDIFFKKINKKSLCQLGIIFTVMIIMFGLWNGFTKNCKWIDNENYEQLNMPVTHWIMMALKGDGTYRQEDFAFSNSFPSKEEKINAHINEIKNRIASYGTVDNFIEFEMNKIAKTISDNRYIQNNHMEWCRNRGLLFDFILESGKYFSKFSAYTKIFGTVLYMLWLLGTIRGIKDNDSNYEFLIYITIFGVILFFTIWETRSRYLMNYTPIFFLAAISGIRYLQKISLRKCFKQFPN